MLLAWDTETTGTDPYHRSRPFAVTVCDEDGGQTFWEWPVHPRTRSPRIPAGDLEEVRGLLGSADRLVGHNLKFDVTALGTVLPGFADAFPWERAEDTLIASHLLASNRPHDLTWLCVQYLGRDIEPYERRLEQAVQECRRYCRTHYPAWRIAKAGDPGAPSAKGQKTWKADLWLPAAVAKQRQEPPDHPYFSVLRDYANTDSAVTLALWREMEYLLRKRGLWKIYRERMRLPAIALMMEAGGVTVNRRRAEELSERFSQESQEYGQRCVRIASKYMISCAECGGTGTTTTTDWGEYGPVGEEEVRFDAEGGFRLTVGPAPPAALYRKACGNCGGRGRHRLRLEMPRSGNNAALRSFCFGQLGLPPCSYSAKTGEPSLDKGSLETWEQTLPSGPALEFVQALRGKRKRDTAVQYLDGYRRFWLPLDRGDPEEEWYVLHPALNITGTATLRWSSSNPNSQNISKQENFGFRSIFGPLPGREWWSLDAKNLELRLPAYQSGERELVDLFEKPDEPPYYGSTHLLNFATVYPDLWAKELVEVGPEKVGPHCKKKYASTWYQRVKNGGFAVQYGAVDKPGGGGTADRAFHKAGAHTLLKARFGRLEELNRRCIAHANKHGYVETLPDRKVDPDRGYPLLVSWTDSGRALETIPLNYVIQGTACWLIGGRAMVECQAVLDHWRREDGFEARMVLQVHDELVFDLPHRRDKGNLPRVLELAARIEECGRDLGVPTPVGIEYHPEHWGKGEVVR